MVCIRHYLFYNRRMWNKWNKRICNLSEKSIFSISITVATCTSFSHTSTSTASIVTTNLSTTNLSTTSTASIATTNLTATSTATATTSTITTSFSHTATFTASITITNLSTTNLSTTSTATVTTSTPPLNFFPTWINLLILFHYACRPNTNDLCASSWFSWDTIRIVFQMRYAHICMVHTP